MFTVCLDDTCKEFTQKLEIKDTKNPEINLKNEKIEITENDDFDPTSNIASVTDIIDGDIKKSDDKELTKDGYVIDSNVDTKKAGSYTVKIIAYDKNGNKTEKEYAVTVKEKPEDPTQNATQQKPQSTNNSSQSQSTTTDPSTNNKPSNNQQTETCVKNGTWRPSYDGEFASYDFNEADAWGEANCPEHYRYLVHTIHDICGYEAWAVNFIPMQ